MSAILVTGASGFTGSNLCRRLVARGESVVAFVRGTTRTADLQSLGVQCRVVDLTSASDVGRQFSGIGEVYHLAAAYRTEHADMKEFRRVNVEATRNLLESAKRSGVRRFVHCSTVGVQGQIDDPPATEEYRTEPGDHYQATKLEGERLAREYAAAGLPLTVVRPVGIYGPGDRRFLKLFRGIDRGQFVMIGSGKTLYHMTYIDDLIDGILLAAGKAEGKGEVFTIGGPRYTTLWELVDLIADVLGKAHQRRRVPLAPILAAAVVCERVCRVIGVNPPIYPRRVEFFSKDRAFDISKARNLLGYAPHVDLPQGLAATATWYRQRGWL